MIGSRERRRRNRSQRPGTLVAEVLTDDAVDQPLDVFGGRCGRRRRRVRHRRGGGRTRHRCCHGHTRHRRCRRGTRHRCCCGRTRHRRRGGRNRQLCWRTRCSGRTGLGRAVDCGRCEPSSRSRGYIPTAVGRLDGRDRAALSKPPAHHAPALRCRSRRHPARSGRGCRPWRTIDSPIRSGCMRICSESSATRTGSRWTILIQLPVAFCAGRMANAAPVPAESPVIRPLIGHALAVGVGHQRRPAGRCACRASWLSLKLASTQTWSRGTTRHQRRAGGDPLADLDRLAGDVPGDRGSDRQPVDGQHRLANAGRGAQDVRMAPDRGPVGQGLVGDERFACTVECRACGGAGRLRPGLRRASVGDGGAGVLQFLAGDGADRPECGPALRSASAPFEVGARAFAVGGVALDIGFAGLDRGCECTVVRERDADLADGLRQLRLGLLERHLGVGRIERAPAVARLRRTACPRPVPRSLSRSPAA